jgi:hypothetical protein
VDELWLDEPPQFGLSISALFSSGLLLESLEFQSEFERVNCAERVVKVSLVEHTKNRCYLMTKPEINSVAWIGDRFVRGEICGLIVQFHGLETRA